MTYVLWLDSLEFVTYHFFVKHFLLNTLLCFSSKLLASSIIQQLATYYLHIKMCKNVITSVSWNWHFVAKTYVFVTRFCDDYWNWFHWHFVRKQDFQTYIFLLYLGRFDISRQVGVFHQAAKNVFVYSKYLLVLHSINGFANDCIFDWLSSALICG